MTNPSDPQVPNQAGTTPSTVQNPDTAPENLNLASAQQDVEAAKAEVHGFLNRVHDIWNAITGSVSQESKQLLAQLHQQFDQESKNVAADVKQDVSAANQDFQATVTEAKETGTGSSEIK